MAMVDAMPVPDSRQKVDELFLFWLSEPSAQEILRKELSKVCGYDLTDSGERSHPQPAVANLQRPKSPTYRTPSPPLHLSNSPKSPRTKRRSKSPRRHLKSGFTSSKIIEEAAASEEVDFPSSPSSPERQQQQTRRTEMGKGVREKEGDTPVVGSSERLRERLTHDGEIDTSVGQERSVSAAKPVEVIPQFFFPNGQPKPGENIDEQLNEAAKLFQQQPNGELSQDDFHAVVKAMKLPLYWKAPLFRACVGKSQTTSVNFATLKKTWQRITQHCHDNAARFVKLLATSGRNYLTETDFEPLVQDIVDTHPGLAFLASAPEFHARYVETVIGRIFYVVDRTWNGRITASELRKSNFLQTLELLEQEQDINQVTDYFSYEHFYVIYCKFWELDTDHDLLIDSQDLSRHADHALTPRIIQRIMSGVVSRDKSTPPDRLSYRDFIWFLLSEEDKTSPRSIEYWFRCLDVDGDGVLSLFELEFFYEEVLQRLQELSIECLSVENTVCQILDMVNPKEKDKITLGDLKCCKLTPVFINTFTNVEKYLDYEQRDPVASSKDDSDALTSDWNRYAAEQYEILLAEEAYENDNSNFEEDTGDSDLGEDEKEMLALLR